VDSRLSSIVGESKSIFESVWQEREGERSDDDNDLTLNHLLNYLSTHLKINTARQVNLTTSP